MGVNATINGINKQMKSCVATIDGVWRRLTGGWETKNGVWQRVFESGNNKLIEFTIWFNYGLNSENSVVCYAEKGMTWGEWVDSDYSAGVDPSGYAASYVWQLINIPTGEGIGVQFAYLPPQDGSLVPVRQYRFLFNESAMKTGVLASDIIANNMAYYL